MQLRSQLTANQYVIHGDTDSNDGFDEHPGLDVPPLEAPERSRSESCKRHRQDDSWPRPAGAMDVEPPMYAGQPMQPPPTAEQPAPAEAWARQNQHDQGQYYSDSHGHWQDRLAETDQYGARIHFHPWSEVLHQISTGPTSSRPGVVCRMPYFHTTQRARTRWTDVPRDGSCFYHSIVQAHGGPRELTMEHFKLTVMSYMDENAAQLGAVLSLTGPEVQARVRSLEKPAVWADELVCLATVCLPRQPLVVVDETAQAVWLFHPSLDADQQAKPPIAIWNRKQHFYAAESEIPNLVDTA
eukprot:5343275-Amphidinium_carterae.1